MTNGERMNDTKDDLTALLSKHGVGQAAIKSLLRLKEQLPESYIQAHIPSLSEAESAILVSALLRRLGPHIGVAFKHADVLKEAGFSAREPRNELQPSLDTEETEEEQETRHQSV